MFSNVFQFFQMKGYKITTKDRSKKIGVAASSLKMLREKASNKFKIKECKIYLAKDGTEVEDEQYFKTLEAQTLFVIADDDEVVKTDFELMYDAIRNVHSDLFDTGDVIKNFVNENRSEFDKFLEEFQGSSQLISQEKIAASLRSEHEEWFEGVPASIATKEEVMLRRSQDRIRGYFYKTKEDLTKSQIYRTNKAGREVIDKIIEIFKLFLTGVDHFGALFDRKWPKKHQSLLSEDDTDGETPRKKLKIAIHSAFEEFSLKEDYCVSLCSELGEFRCHGLWNNERCSYAGHSINPYSSKENVILFQIWNLDHQIEISRSVIPSLLAQVERIAEGDAICPKHKRAAETISVMRYFLELFTMENLKLVHIVCHDKGSHDLRSKGGVICKKCAEYKILDKILQKIGVDIL